LKRRGAKCVAGTDAASKFALVIASGSLFRSQKPTRAPAASLPAQGAGAAFHDESQMKVDETTLRAPSHFYSLISVINP